MSALDTQDLSLRALARLGPEQLDELYRGAKTPALQELQGDYDGLLIDGQLPPAQSRFPITVVNGPWLPWRGKVFFAADKERGRGANRFSVGSLERVVWPFETSIVPSQFGGDPALLISYNLEGNSFFMRRGVFDELKKLRDDLFLGKGGLRLGGKNRFVFTWAIEKRA